MLRQSLRSAVCILGLALLPACSAPPAETPDATVADPATAPVARPATVLDDQLKALDKARAVEQDLQEAKVARDKAIEDAGG